MPGSKGIYTSADEPGLIYDTVSVSPASAKARRADWIKFIKVWDKVVAYIEDPKTQADAVKIMAARSGVTPAEYLPLLKGTKLLSLAASSKVYTKGEGYSSIYGATKLVDQFNTSNAVYKGAQPVETYLDPSFTNAK